MDNKLGVLFEVPRHYITASEYNALLESLNGILSDFNTRLFDNTLSVELHVLPHEQGSFKAWIGIGATLLFGSVISDVGKGFINGLVGKELNYTEMGHDIGNTLKDILVSFISLPNVDLKIPEVINLDASLKHKSDLYDMFSGIENLKSITYDNQPKILKHNFYKYVTQDRIPDIKLRIRKEIAKKNKLSYKRDYGR